MTALLQFLFGCTHGKLSRVFTIRKQTYRVCLDCGREFAYDWQDMRIVPEREAGRLETCEQ